MVRNCAAMSKVATLNSPSVFSVEKASLHKATAEQKAVVLGHG